MVRFSDDAGCLSEAAIPVDTFSGRKVSTRDGLGSVDYFLQMSLFLGVRVVEPGHVASSQHALCCTPVDVHESIRRHTKTLGSSKVVEVLMGFPQITLMCLAFLYTCCPYPQCLRRGAVGIGWVSNCSTFCTRYTLQPLCTSGGGSEWSGWWMGCQSRGRLCLGVNNIREKENISSHGFSIAFSSISMYLQPEWSCYIDSAVMLECIQFVYGKLV